MKFVQHSWDEFQDKFQDESGMIQLCLKLKRLQLLCSRWNRDTFGNIFNNINTIKRNAKEAERQFFDNPSNHNLFEMNKQNANLINALNIEETFWNQKASINWLKDGDRNTTYFFNYVKGRRNRNWA